MPLYQAIVLAVVQALTEFLPISSTAHLALFPWFTGWKDPGLTFDVALHAGTLIAVVVYFWREWLEMLAALVGAERFGFLKQGSEGRRAIFGRANPGLAHPRQLFVYLVIATLPAGFAGLLLEEAAESRFRNPLVMGTMLIVVGLLMWAGEHVKSHRKNLDDVSFTDAILIGVAQAVAIIPGTSRSGITMVTGLFRGMTRETSARFSFLLSTPIIAGAALKEGVDVLQAGLPDDMLLPFVVGTAVSGLVGYVVIAGLLHFLTRRTFKIFIVYRLVLGVVVLLLGWGWRHHLG